MTAYDAVVVGNGPSGSVAACHGSAQYDVLIVGAGERRVECAGLISRSGMRRIGVDRRDFVLNSVRGAKIYSPGGVEVVVDGGADTAYAIDRPAFDRHLLDKAVDCGARYADDWVKSINGQVTLRSGERIEANKIVLATGTDYTLQINSGIPRPREFLIGGQYEMEVECDKDYVELHFRVPDFFAWVIPLGDRARVGLCVKTNPRPYIDSFVKSLKAQGRLKSDKILAESFGIIPVHDPALRTQFSNIVTVGDAAGQVKASTGGGVIFGAIAAENALSPDYERIWRKQIGWDMRLHLLIHRSLNRLSDRGKDRLFSILKEHHRSLERGGDMDFAAQTIKSMLTDRDFMLSAGANLPWLIADMIR